MTLDENPVIDFEPIDEKGSKLDFEPIDESPKESITPSQDYGGAGTAPASDPYPAPPAWMDIPEAPPEVAQQARDAQKTAGLAMTALTIPSKLDWSDQYTEKQLKAALMEKEANILLEKQDLEKKLSRYHPVTGELEKEADIMARFATGNDTELLPAGYEGMARAQSRVKELKRQAAIMAQEYPTDAEKLARAEEKQRMELEQIRERIKKEVYGEGPNPVFSTVLRTGGALAGQLGGALAFFTGNKEDGSIAYELSNVEKSIRDATGVDESTAGRVAGAIGDTLGLIVGPTGKSGLARTAFGLSTAARAAAHAYGNALSSGETKEQAQKSALMTAVEMAAFLGLAHRAKAGITSITGSLKPTAAPAALAAEETLKSGVANMGASGALRFAHGEGFAPTLESAVTDWTFAAHGGMNAFGQGRAQIRQRAAELEKRNQGQPASSQAGMTSEQRIKAEGDKINQLLSDPNLPPEDAAALRKLAADHGIELKSEPAPVAKVEGKTISELEKRDQGQPAVQDIDANRVPLTYNDRRALRDRAQAVVDALPRMERVHAQRRLDSAEQNHRELRRELEDAKTVGQKLSAEMELVEQENRMRRIAGESELETARPVTEADQKANRDYLAKRITEVEAKIKAGEPLTKQDRGDWVTGGRKASELPKEPEPVAAPTAEKPAEPVATPDAGKSRVGEWTTENEGPITPAQYGRTMDAYDAFARVSPKVEKAIREGTATPDQLQSATEQPLLFDTPKQKRDAFVLRDALRRAIDDNSALPEGEQRDRNHKRLTDMLGKVEQQIVEANRPSDIPAPVVPEAAAPVAPVATPKTPKKPKAAAPAKPASGDFALKQQQASKTRSRKLNIPPAPNDTPDIIDTILGDHGKIKSRNQARLQKLKAEGKNRFQKTQQGGEYDGWNDLPPRLKKLLIDESGGGTTPDVMADNVGMEGDSSGLREKLIKAWEARLDWQKEQKRIAREGKAAEPAMKKQEKREQDFRQASGPESSDPLAFPIEGKDLKPGDDVVVDGETLKVTDNDGDTVTLEGGDRFGTQRLDVGDTIYGDHIKGEGHAEKPAEPVAEKPAEPTAKKPAKPFDELLGDETPFNLTAETAKEQTERQARELADEQKKAAEKEASDKAENDKAQGGLFGEGEVPVKEVPKTPEQIHADAQAEYKKASAKHTEITRAYRAREIGDDEFIAGRKEFDAALKAREAADVEFVKAQKERARAEKAKAKKDDAEGDMFSPQSISDEAPKTPLHPSVVQRVVNSLRNRFKGSAETRVIADGEQYPDAVKAVAKKRGINLNRIGGLLHDGVVWLNAAALHSPERAAEVFFHEQAGHVGVDALLDGLSPKSSSRLMDALAREFPEEYKYVVGDEETPSNYLPSEHLSETLARIMEKFGPKSDATPKDQSRWRRIVDFIRNILVKSGIKKWSKNDIEALLRRGIDKIRRGDGEANKGDTKLSIEEEKRVTPEQDAAYAKAAEAGDTETAQRMVDEAAYEAGYTIQTKHGTRGGFDVFDRKASPLQNSTFDLNRWGVWTTDDAPEIYGPKTLRLYGKMESPKRFQTFDEWFKNYISKAYPIFAPTEGIKDFLKDLREYTGKAQPGTAEYRKLLADFEGADGYRKYLKSEGHDGVIIEGDHIDGKLQTVRIFLEPEQLKSADPITRDASGKVIPLSERFNPKSDDIRFSIEGDNEEKGTSNKEAIVNQERAARGLEPIEKEGKITNTRALSIGQSELAAHPGRANEIIAELRHGNGMEREISLEKGAVLLAHRRNLTTDYYKALDRMGDSDLSPSARAAASIEAHGFEKALGELDQAAQDARSTWGRFGQFWKQQLKADFTFEALKRKLKAEKRGELTEEEEAGLRDVAAKHKEASEQEKKAAADLEELSRSKAEKEELKKQLDEAKAEVADERTFTKGIREKFKDSIKAKSVIRKVKGLNVLHLLLAQKGIKFSVEDGEGSFAEKFRDAISDVGAGILGEAEYSRPQFEAKMREILGDNAPKDMEQLWKDSREKLSSDIQASIEQGKKRSSSKTKTEKPDEGDAFDLGERDIESERDATTAALAEKAKEGLSKGQLRRYITALARGFIKEGITEIEPLTDALHAEVQKALPDITRTETRDAFSGFGEWKKLSTDPDEVLRQQLVSEAQTVSKIEHLQKQVESGATEVGLPPKTGKERADQRPQKREREAKYKKLLKELLQSGKIKVTTDPAKQLKTTLDGIKTRLKNEIDDLDFALATRERRVNRDKTSTEYDAEAKALKEKRDAKKAEYDKMFPKEPITEEQQLKRAEVVARKNLESWEKKLEDAKNGKFDAAEKEQGPINQRVQHLRDMAKAARAELQNLRDLADPPISDAQKKLNAALIARERWEQILSGDLTTNKPKQQEALTDLEHDVKLEIDAMKRLVADLKKAQKPATDPEAAREAAKIRALEKATSEYERRAKAMDFTKAAGKVNRPDTYKMSVVRSAYEAAKAAYEAAKATTVEVKSDLEKTISARYAHALRRIADLAERRRTSNFSPRPKKPEGIATTPKEKEAALKLQKAIIAKKKLELKFNQDKEAYRLKHRTGLEKTLDGIAKWGRAFVLTGFHTIEKLTSAAAMITSLAPVEQTLGAIAAKALPKSITENAPTRSIVSVQTEIKAVTETFRNLFKDFRDALTKGSTDLDFLYGKPDIAPHDFLDYIGNLHYALKTAAKRNEWTRHFEYDMKHEARLAAKRGETFDPLDPAIQLRSGIKAYKASMRSIFSEENVVTEGFKAGLRWLSQAKDGKGNARVSAQTLKFLVNYTMPIVKIPTNIVARMFEYSLGGAIAGGKIMYAGLGNVIGERGKTGKWNLREDFRKGLEAMPPEAADSIIRNLARGSLGAALLTIGYFYPQAIGGYYTKDRKQEDGEPAYGTVGNIPKVLLHNPLLEQLQIGATIRKVADTLNPDGDPNGHTAGTKAALLGMLEQTPFVREAGLIRALQNDNAGAQMWADQTSGRIVPQGIKELARALDTDKQGNPVKRNPSTFGERTKMNLPWLRNEVPVKEEEYHPMRAPSIRRKKRS